MLQDQYCWPYLCSTRHSYVSFLQEYLESLGLNVQLMAAKTVVSEVSVIPILKTAEKLPVAHQRNLLTHSGLGLHVR